MSEIFGTSEIELTELYLNVSGRIFPIVDDVINEVIEGLELIQHHGMESAGNRINSYMPQEN